MAQNTEIILGRPRMYSDPAELEAKGVEYMTQCESKKTIPTTAGLAFYLGFADRQSLYDYKEHPTFTCVIKRLILAIEAIHESRLQEAACAGSIFWLKNHKWTDRQDLAVSTPDGAIKIDPGRDKLTDEQLAKLISIAEGNQ